MWLAGMIHIVYDNHVVLVSSLSLNGGLMRHKTQDFPSITNETMRLVVFFSIAWEEKKNVESIEKIKKLS